jgi:hypothetical protein
METENKQFIGKVATKVLTDLIGEAEARLRAADLREAGRDRAADNDQLVISSIAIYATVTRSLGHERT